jgi:hypothetical protein
VGPAYYRLRPARGLRRLFFRYESDRAKAYRPVLCPKCGIVATVETEVNPELVPKPPPLKVADEDTSPAAGKTEAP